MISITIYKEIVELINSAQERGSDMVSSMNRCVSDLYNSEVNSTNNDKEWLYNEVEVIKNLIEDNHAEYSSEMLGFILSLQTYIYEQYGSVNNFLRDNNETVRETFADMSNEVGFPINGDLIQSSSDICSSNPSN